MISSDCWDYFTVFIQSCKLLEISQYSRRQKIFWRCWLHVKLLTPGFLILHISITSNSFCKQSMLDMTAFLEVKIPPFLSRAVSKGQFKSPPIMIFSSESKLSFCNKVSRFVKKCVSSVFLFGAYTLIRTTGFSWISALRIMYLPSGSNNFKCILWSTPLLKRTATPRASEVPGALIISAPHSCLQDVSCSIVKCVSCLSSAPSENSSSLFKIT